MARTVDRLGLLLLVVGSAFSRRVVRVEGIALSGDRLLGLAAVLVALALLARGRLRFSPIHGALTLFVGVQILTTLASAHLWPRGMRLVVIYVLGLACFLLAAHFAAAGDCRRFGARVWIAVGAAAGGLGTVLVLAANVLDTRLPGTVRVPLDGGSEAPLAFAPSLTFFEHNILGSFLVAAFALALWGAGADRHPTPGSLPDLRWLVPIATGIVFSFTRAAWLAAAAIALAWAKGAGLSRRVVWTSASVAAGLACAFVLVVGAPAILQKTVRPFLSGKDPSMSIRIAGHRDILRSWAARPLIGYGAGSAALVPEPGTIQGRWAGNVFVHVLHDSGLTGLGAFLLLMAVVWRQVRRRIARGRDADWHTLGVSLVAASLGVLFASLFTHVLWVMYPYVLLGLLAAELESPGRAAPGAAAPVEPEPR